MNYENGIIKSYRKKDSEISDLESDFYNKCYGYVAQFFRQNEGAATNNYYTFDKIAVNGLRSGSHHICGIVKVVTNPPTEGFNRSSYLIESDDIVNSEPIYFEEINRTDLINILACLPFEIPDACS